MSQFQDQYSGAFKGILRWPQLDELWNNVRKRPTGWYLYHIGADVPESSAGSEQLETFIAELDELLHREHEHDYCGIVYADDRDEPAMIKIYDPGNLGSVCGSSGEPVPPRWLMSRIKPERLEDDAVTPANRHRWWKKIFG